MEKTIVTFMVLLALLLAIPWISYAGQGHAGTASVFISGTFWSSPLHYDGQPPVAVPQTPVYVQQGQDESDYWHQCDNPIGLIPLQQIMSERLNESGSRNRPA